VWLENGQGVVYERTFVPLAVDGRPPSQWTDGERAVGRIAVWVPAGAPTGRYDAYMSVLDQNGVPVTLEGDLWGVFQDEPGIIRIGPVLVEESSLGLPDDAEIFAEFGGPLHDR
jgi:catechol 2,3-dioxygenase-like lactoylglutathione lyase family enzyme